LDQREKLPEGEARRNWGEIQGCEKYEGKKLFCWGENIS